MLPVAGVGTRFLPATKVVPKELLPLIDKPVIQYLVEEAVGSGIEEIIFVISKEKELIREHFSAKPELEEFLKKKGRSKILEKVKPIHRLAKFTYVYQDQPLGDGDAVLKAEKVVGDEPFLVLFGDDIIKNGVHAAHQLIDKFSGEAVIAVKKVPDEQVSHYGIIKPGRKEGRLHEVTGMIEKPAPDQAPSNFGVVGKYVCPPEIFEAIKSSEASKDGELRLIDGLIKLSETQKIWALEIEGERFDTGRPEGLVAASNAFL